MSMKAKQSLKKVFEHFKLGAVHEVRRVYAGRHQRSAGAWSWYAGRSANIGSQWSVHEVLRAFREKRLDIYRQQGGDIHFMVENVPL